MNNDFQVLKCVQRIEPDTFQPYYETIVTIDIPVLSIMDACHDEATADVLADNLGAALLKAIDKYKHGKM